MKTHDDLFEWQGFGNGFGKWESMCRIRVYEHEERQIIVATELPENTGTSITNAAENLAILVINKYELDLKRVVWIEHYSKIKHQDESFDIVSFKMAPGPANPLNPRELRMALADPAWKRIKKAHVESLCGEAV